MKKSCYSSTYGMTSDNLFAYRKDYSIEIEKFVCREILFLSFLFDASLCVIKDGGRGV